MVEEINEKIKIKSSNCHIDTNELHDEEHSEIIQNNVEVFELNKQRIES
jgi:hypothetical protein